MQDKVSQKPQESVGHSPQQELSEYQKELETKYEHVNPEDIFLSSGKEALMGFNGYYALDNHTSGAFFTVDTNMYMKNGASTPIYDISFIICLDGTHSIRIPFEGSFEGGKLIQKYYGYQLELTFTREDTGSDGYTATFSGSIVLPSLTPASIVSGYTYNNPIPYTTYVGEYYLVTDVNKKNVSLKLHLQDNYNLLYDYGDEKLQQVPSYTFNLNMYFFSFSKGSQFTSLIMGTSAGKGLVCNNMIADYSINKVTSRSLNTIPFPDIVSNSGPSSDILMSPEEINNLATFSGYYQIPSIGSGAFVSILTEYIKPGNRVAVKIGFSLDGITSKQYEFDNTMSFEHNKLSIPAESLALEFNREHKKMKGFGILGTVNGFIKEKEVIAGFTFFNPVPLSAFGGVPLTDTKENQDQLIVVSDEEVKYNGATIRDFIYVPTMYVLAYPAEKPTLEMSFGTNGACGNTCLVIDYESAGTEFAVVNAINTPSQTISVFANLPWQNTGINISGSRAATITQIGGKWTANPKDNNGNLYSATGNPNYINAKSGYTKPGENEGALIGRVGDQTFLIGVNGVTPVGCNGVLELCINDDLHGKYGSGLMDNEGFVKVQIIID